MSQTMSLLQFAAVLGGAINRMHAAQHTALERSAVIVETEAKRVLGTHDYGWPPLAQSTIARKANGDTPGLETGGMRDSVEHNSDHESFAVGSNDKKALWFELGTVNQPPRPFLSQAIVRKMPEIQNELATTIFTIAFNSP